MKLGITKSKDVIDRRRSWLAAIGAALLLVVGVVVGRDFGAPDPEAKLVEVVSTSLDRGQDFWVERVPGYRRAKAVLYRDRTRTGCGTGRAASGPFYCPADERIYIDLSFLMAIDGELARAYVVAHELGHHVQHIRGIAAASIEIELAADCLAGRWIFDEQRNGHLAPGDIDGALAEAAAVGDDQLCPQCTTDQWTHGSAAQRRAALLAGMNTLNECETI